MGLDDEDIGAPDRRVVTAVDLAVSELAQVGLAEFDPEAVRDLLGELAVGTTAEQREPTGRHDLHHRHILPFP